MSNDKVVSLAAPATVSNPLTDLLRAGARRLIEAAVQAELEEFLSAFERETLADGRRRVVRNGHLPDCGLRWPRPRGSFGPVYTRARARTCSLNRSPRCAFGREYANPTTEFFPSGRGNL